MSTTIGKVVRFRPYFMQNSTYPFFKLTECVYFLTPSSFEHNVEIISFNQRHLCMFSRIPGLQCERRWTRLPSVMENSPRILSPLSLHLWGRRLKRPLVSSSVSPSVHQPLDAAIVRAAGSRCGGGGGGDDGRSLVSALARCLCLARLSPARQSARALGAQRLVTWAWRGGATGEKATKFCFSF